MTSAPTLLLVTDRMQTAGRPLAEVVTACVTGGIRHVFLRERDLSRPAYDELLSLLRTRLEDRATIFTRAPTQGAPGCHLAASDTFPGDRPAIVGRSVHDVGEIRRAAREGVDYVLAGPYAESVSKPGYGPALGPTGIARLTRIAGVPPVLAVGGVLPADTAALAAAGAGGLAVMGPLMRATDPAALAAEYAASVAPF